MMAEDCPGCKVLAQVMHRAADALAGGAGAVVGGSLGGLMTARTGDPRHVTRGTVAGSLLAPHIIETGALAIRDKVKRKRRQTKSQRDRSRKLSKAMSQANKKARKKDGSFRNGWNQKKLMQTAHRLARK